MTTGIITAFKIDHWCWWTCQAVVYQIAITCKTCWMTTKKIAGKSEARRATSTLIDQVSCTSFARLMAAVVLATDNESSCTGLAVID